MKILCLYLLCCCCGCLVLSLDLKIFFLCFLDKRLTLMGRRYGWKNIARFPKWPKSEPTYYWAYSGQCWWYWAMLGDAELTILNSINRTKLLPSHYYSVEPIGWTPVPTSQSIYSMVNLPNPWLSYLISYAILSYPFSWTALNCLSPLVIILGLSNALPLHWCIQLVLLQDVMLYLHPRTHCIWHWD